MKKIETEHIIQLLLYKFINEKNGIHLDKYYLYNVLTNQLFNLECSYENLFKMVTRLIKVKFIDKDTLDSDEAFMDSLREEGVIG